MLEKQNKEKRWLDCHSCQNHSVTLGQPSGQRGQPWKSCQSLLLFFFLPLTFAFPTLFGDWPAGIILILHKVKLSVLLWHWICNSRELQGFVQKIINKKSNSQSSDHKPEDRCNGCGRASLLETVKQAAETQPITPLCSAKIKTLMIHIRWCKTKSCYT